MPIDENTGADLGAVGIPLTGFAAVQLDGSPTVLDSEAGAANPLKLPEGYKKVGLFKVDGGPQESAETEDAIEYFQDGFKTAGRGTLTIAINLAEMNEHVRRLTTGKKPDKNGMITIDAATPDNVFPLFVTTQYKNGWQRRLNGFARISAVEKDQETRGEVNGRATTFEWVYRPEIGGYFREWVIKPQSVLEED
ncbi:hypothetical protein [Trueperella pyogenes]|uniref:hypothetical protein n=1 Tax=Trueperella pyogenes TaxID=1661 RepID=UPI00345DAF8B